MTTPSTPSQTIGPFFHDALMRHGVEDLDPKQVAGEPVEIHGRVVDGVGNPVTDALLEIWQADGGGRYRHPADGRHADVPTEFVGFGRLATGADGTYRARTVFPGTVPGRDGQAQAPHLNVQMFARGLINPVWTRIYFGGQLANDDDALLQAVPEARRGTLIARPGTAQGDDPQGGLHRYRFDIVLQGDEETVFFAT
jgi:protocatechuate 3,4-dioxygenase, alpha subunit